MNLNGIYSASKNAFDSHWHPHMRGIIRDLLHEFDDKKIISYNRGELWGIKSWQGPIGDNYYLFTISKDSIGLVSPSELIVRIPITQNEDSAWLHAYSLKDKNWVKNDSKIILGITKEGHDSSAAIVDLSDGQVLAFCQEERISRCKHERRFPYKSIAEVLRQAKCSSDDIGAIAIGHSLGWYNKSKVDSPPYLEYFKTLPPNFAKIDLSHRNNIKSYIRKMATALRIDTSQLPPIYFVRHHLAHVFAAQTVASDIWKESIIVTADGRGEWETITAWRCYQDKLQELFTKSMPDSLAYFYTTLGEIFGWHFYGFEGRVMGLAPYGYPKNETEEIIFKKIHNLIDNFFHSNKGKLFSLNTEVIKGGYFPKRISEYNARGWWINAFTLESGIKQELIRIVNPILSGEKIDPFKAKYRNICILANVIQNVFCTHWVNTCLTAIQGGKQVEGLLLSGGVALNSSANGEIAKIINKKGVELRVPPFPADDGLAVGAAAALGWAIGNSFNKTRISTAKLGKKVTSDDVQRVFDAYGLKQNLHYRKLHSFEDEVEIVVSALLSGSAVAIFRGREEAGPRALGGRSILFPTQTNNPMLSANIAKNREEWRPIAASILCENEEKHFYPIVKSTYMNICAQSNNNLNHGLSKVLHPGDMSCRVQTVDEESSPFLYKVLQLLQKKSSHAVVNTSFNLNEPMVHTIQEALDTYLYLEGVKYLFIEGYWVKSKQFLPSLLYGKMEKNIDIGLKALLGIGDSSLLISALQEHQLGNHQAYIKTNDHLNSKLPLFRELYNKHCRENFLQQLHLSNIKITEIKCKFHSELKNILEDCLRHRSKC